MPRLALTAGALVLLLSGCMATVGEPVQRRVSESPRMANYDYLDQWSLEEARPSQNIWIDSYDRSLRDTLARSVTCHVAFQITGAPAPEAEFVDLVEELARQIAEENEAEDFEIEETDEDLAGRPVKRLAATFVLSGSHVTTFDSGTVITKPVEMDWRVDGAIMRIGNDHVLTVCVNNERDRELARAFIDTVSTSFAFEQTS